MKKEEENLRSWYWKMNKEILRNIIIFIVLILIVFGAWMVLSSSAGFSAEKVGGFSKLFFKQIIALLVAIFMFFIGFGMNYKVLSKFSIYLYFAAVILLVITLTSGSTAKGGTRWLDLGVFSFQPSEFAKVALIIHLATLGIRKGEKLRLFKTGLLHPLIFIGIISGLIMFQPNFSTAIIVGILGLAVLYVAGARFLHLAGTIAVLGLIVGFLLMTVSHTRARILNWFNSFISGEGELHYQVQQAHIALGSGGLFGLGVGNSQQSNLFVAEGYGDFIFSIVGEEWGFLGTVAIASLFMLFFITSILLINEVEDEYGKILIFGLSFNITISAIINMMVVLGIAPTTGITLPFISYGGTSLIIFAYSVGVILNISHDGKTLTFNRNSIMNKAKEIFERPE